MNFEEISQEYVKQLAKLSDQEKAQLEAKIWAYAPLPGKRPLKRDWFAKNFGVNGQYVEMRHTLFSLGAAANKLWQRLENGTSMYTIIRLVRDARKRAEKEGLSLTDAVEASLLHYDRTGYEVTTPSGKKIRKRAPGSKPRKKTAVPGDTRELRHELRTVVNAAANKMLDGLDSYESKKIREELIAWIESGVDTFARKVYNLRTSAKEDRLFAKIGKTRFTQALEVLALSPKDFVFGKEIDIKKAKKSYMKRAAALHPDSNGGSEAKLAEYQAVNDAINVLEQYMEQLGEAA